MGGRRAFIRDGLLILLLSGCGYRPVSQYSTNLLGNSAFVDVILDLKEPSNGVYLKEEIIKTLRERLNTTVVADKKRADSIIIVPKYSFSYSPLNYDRNGYVIRYRVHTTITFELITPKGRFKKVIHVDEDVGIKASSLTSSIARDTAIRYSIRKAMDKFIAFVAQKGYMQ